MHSMHAAELTLEQYSKNMEEQQPAWEKLLLAHLKTVAPEFQETDPDPESSDYWKKTKITPNLIDRAGHDEIPVSVPLMLCAMLAKEDLFQDTLRSAKINGVENIYSFELVG